MMSLLKKYYTWQGFRVGCLRTAKAHKKFKA
jgi:hypothetical protein